MKKFRLLTVSLSDFPSSHMKELVMHCCKNILISFFLSWIVFGMSVTARADSFEAPAEVESIVKKNYEKYQFWRGSECLLIDGGHEFCALAIDKSVEDYPDFREIDMLLTISDRKRKILGYKILKNWLDSDGMSLSIDNIQFGIWEKLKSNGRIFSITIKEEGSSRVNSYDGKELTFFKLLNDRILQISNPISIYKFNSENDMADKFSRAISRRIIIIKEQNNQQFLVTRVSACEDDDTVPEKNNCNNRKVKWKNEKIVRFDNEFMDLGSSDF